MFMKNIKKLQVREPSPLIDCTTYTLDFEECKFLNVGIVASSEFNFGVGGYDGEGFGIVIRLLTAKRYIDIRYGLLNRIYSMMGEILSIIPESHPSPSISPPLKRSRGISHLIPIGDSADEVDSILPTSILLMTDIDNGANGNGVVKARTHVKKKRSKGRNVVSIESKTHPECYVLLDREDLLTLQKLKYCIRDSVTRKTLITLPAIVKQASCMVRYLETSYGRSPGMYEETKSCIENMQEDFIHSIAQGEGCTDPGYANEIKTLSADALAHLWYGQDVCGRYGMGGERAAPPSTSTSLHQHVMPEPLTTVVFENDYVTSYSPPAAPSSPEIGEPGRSNMTSPQRPMSPSSFLASYDFY